MGDLKIVKIKCKDNSFSCVCLNSIEMIGSVTSGEKYHQFIIYFKSGLQIVNSNDTVSELIKTHSSLCKAFLKLEQIKSNIRNSAQK